MQGFFSLLLPEIILVTVACVLTLVGCSMKVASRKVAPFLALLALVAAFIVLCTRSDAAHAGYDFTNTFRIFHFADFIRTLAVGVGILLVLLAWPTNAEGTGNPALNVGQETGEFLGLMLFSLTGVLLVAGANDIILLFLGIELASIPTYIMVSISRPTPVAQEAGVKYFFLGAMAAAVMLFGFSYLYGTTGSIKLDQIAKVFHGASSSPLTPWRTLAVVMLIGGFAFKIAAVPLHVYAGDVYQGAATPVTAFLSFVPKTSGFVALIKILYTVGGPTWTVSPQITKLLWILAVLTMTFGNVLGLLQYNIKRLLAYSSIAHSGYMLVGVATLVGTTDRSIQSSALQGVLFYLTAYGIMNAAAFGVLMLLPARDNVYGSWRQASASGAGTSAETFEDIAGTGRRHVGLGLCMAVACFSLIGLPLTVGFFGKLMLIKPALAAGFNWLVVLTMLNAAISAAYYLRIVGTMFLREVPADESDAAAANMPTPTSHPLPIALSIGLSVLGTLILGIVLPATQTVAGRADTAARHVDDATIPATNLRADAR
jgi:NADH-quinone oxidoreductase subunit N